MLVQEPLTDYRASLREALSAGEPLNPTVIEQVRAAWGITIRDGYGQTETTALVGNMPGMKLKSGSMGRPLIGMPIVLLDHGGEPSDEGEVCIDLSNPPVGLTPGYVGGDVTTSNATRDGYYHTGDVAVRDHEGYLTFVGRLDDVFKSADYRISRSKSRACWSSMMRSQKRRSCPAWMKSDIQCPRRSSCSLPVTSQLVSWLPASWRMPPIDWRRTNESGGSNLPSSPRRCPARSVESSCGRSSANGERRVNGCPSSSSRRIS
jgi:hypothetical protein